MAAEKFRATEDAYFKLRGQFDIGRITQEQFDEKLREHIVQDVSGHFWMLGADSGKWYFYDGVNWVPGNPLNETEAAAIAQPRTAAAPATAPLRDPTSVYAAPRPAVIPESGGGIPLLPILVGVAIVMLAIGASLLFQNRDNIFVAQQVPAQETPIVSPTRSNILYPGTSEPDFFNTSTPVAAATVTPFEIPTLEPTSPVPVIVQTQQSSSNIPTITPSVLSTPVPQSPTPATLPPPPTGRIRLGNGADARARYIPGSQFVLDGSLSEWSGDGVLLTVPHFGADNWFGPGDLSGTAWMGWNENFLLLAVNVLDDAHVQTQRSWESFRGDSVELWIDADLEGDFDDAAGNGDDYQFGFAPGDFAGLVPEGVLYIPYRDVVVNQQIIVAARPNSTGYTLEAAVPWAVLRIQPEQGRVLGYTIDLSDNDVPVTAQQQTQVTHNPNFLFQMPATFGNLILE